MIKQTIFRCAVSASAYRTLCFRKKIARRVSIIALTTSRRVTAKTTRTCYDGDSVITVTSFTAYTRKRWY